ncbi:hypothetical protein GH733_008494 [Mirounga leonina]|nr:hypothetical protein GH733_008494 [Mirounga leonina]
MVTAGCQVATKVCLLLQLPLQEQTLANDAYHHAHMLAREVLRMHGTISREHPWVVMSDLYFYRVLKRLKRKSRLL